MFPSSFSMPRHPHSPIAKLHIDILWAIFTLNSHASMERDWTNESTDLREPGEPTILTTALKDNRSCSQVCKLWRNVILSSSSIWANSLDLEYLNQRDPKDRWRNEVLKRTGNASLTLVGDTSASVEANTTRFFLSIIEGHLYRVRRLSIYITVFDGTGDCERRVYAAMQSPAPKMEHLALNTRCHHAGDWRTGGGISLQTLAPGTPHPRLHYLCISGFQLTLSSGYLSSITELYLGDIRALSTSALLKGLLEMPLLKFLDLERGSNTVLREENLSTLVLPTVTLPCLVKIKIASGFHLLEDVITHIVPSTSCCISFTHYIRDIYPEEMGAPSIILESDVEREQFGNVLGRYLSPRIAAYEAPIYLTLGVCEQDRIADSPGRGRDMTLCVFFEVCPETHPESDRILLQYSDADCQYVRDCGRRMFNIMDGILLGLSYCDLSCVTVLDLRKFEAHLLDPQSPLIRKLLASFINVHTVYTTTEVLRFLVDAHTKLVDKGLTIIVSEVEGRLEDEEFPVEQWFVRERVLSD